MSDGWHEVSKIAGVNLHHGRYITNGNSSFAPDKIERQIGRIRSKARHIMKSPIPKPHIRPLGCRGGYIREAIRSPSLPRKRDPRVHHLHKTRAKKDLPLVDVLYVCSEAID
jgi:hypothetical protein